MKSKTSTSTVYPHTQSRIARACTWTPFILGFAPLALGFMGSASWAQTPAVKPAASQAAPSEAAIKAANSPYRWILINANTQGARQPPRKDVAAPSPAAAAQAPAQTAARKPDAAPAPSPIVEVVTPLPAPTVEVRAAPVVAAIAPAPAPAPRPAAPVIAAVPPPPPPAPPTPPKLNTELHIVTQTEPRFSAAILREISKAAIKVAFTVNKDGSTSDVKIVASNARVMNNPLMAAVREWKYRPIDVAQPTEIDFLYSE